ncbi:mitochondrial protein Pet127-domain-containing protein [Salix suchowensis]|nr:mitochondrial protein Pet127-domain-containing protein [Salix suchowensis]
MDVLNYEENSGYLIRTLQGPLESFEREYYDLIRSAFLKYSFQARIGNMDGVLVAYHNTARLSASNTSHSKKWTSGSSAHPKSATRLPKVPRVVGDRCRRGYQDIPQTDLGGERQDGHMGQPLDADDSAESQKTAPMKQIQVTATNYLDELRTRGPKAVEAPKDSDSSGEANDVQGLYIGLSRLSRTTSQIFSSGKPPLLRHGFNFPRRVPDAVVSTTSDSIPEQDGGGVASPTINPDNFRSPDKRIEFLRSVARSGREHTEAVADQRKGMPRLVWGEGEPWVDEHGVFDEPAEQTEIVTSEAISSTEVASETLEALPEALSDGVVGDVARMAMLMLISPMIFPLSKSRHGHATVPVTDHTYSIPWRAAG